MAWMIQGVEEVEEGVLVADPIDHPSSHWLGYSGPRECMENVSGARRRKRTIHDEKTALCPVSGPVNCQEGDPPMVKRVLLFLCLAVALCLSTFGFPYLPALAKLVFYTLFSGVLAVSSLVVVVQHSLGLALRKKASPGTLVLFLLICLPISGILIVLTLIEWKEYLMR